MEVPEEDMEVQEETVPSALGSIFGSYFGGM